MINLKKINIIYDGNYDDVDIISIPDHIFLKSREIVQEFLLWEAPEEDSDYWMVLENKRYCVVETKGFVKWLNTFYCGELEKAHIVKEKTHYCSEYDIIEF